MGFVKPPFLADSFAKCVAILNVMEGNRTYRNRNPKGEPQLGRRGLYGAIGGSGDGDSARMAMLWVLNLSDGDHSLLDIADRASLPFDLVRDAADALAAAGLLEER
jgi:aminopeptidase-like protein